MLNIILLSEFIDIALSYGPLLHKATQKYTWFVMLGWFFLPFFDRDRFLLLVTQFQGAGVEMKKIIVVHCPFGSMNPHNSDGILSTGIFGSLHCSLMYL